MKKYLIRLGWTVELARERKENSMKYAREAKVNGWSRSYSVLFVELARKYSQYIRILSRP